MFFSILAALIVFGALLAISLNGLKSSTAASERFGHARRQRTAAVANGQPAAQSDTPRG